MPDPICIAAVVLVDARGWLLLQERDEHAPVAPEQWGMVGGHVEPGEEFESAAYRELAEETGLRCDRGLHLFVDEVFQHANNGLLIRCQVWAGASDLTDRDIVVGEGRQIVFVDPARVAALDLGESAAHFLPAFLRSRLYADLVVRDG